LFLSIKKETKNIKFSLFKTERFKMDVSKIECTVCNDKHCSPCGTFISKGQRVQYETRFSPSPYFYCDKHELKCTICKGTPTIMVQIENVTDYLCASCI